MGEVYRADDTRLHRQVAIKVLPSHLADDEASLERFRRETRAVAALSHPNILAIFDVGETDGVHYAVTELLEGETLRSRIGRGRLSPRNALEILLEIADGVAAAHARGIVHRDLKPENVFITTSGRVKVLDFGLARGAPELVNLGSLTEILPTQPGIVMGTLGYLAPEQLEARAPAPPSDVFALGCVLYEMVAGHTPFDRPSSAHAMVAVMHDPAPRLQNTGEPLLRDVDTLIQKCLEKNPEERFADAGALADAIRSVFGGKRLRRKSTVPWRWLAAAIVLIAALAGGWLAYAARTKQLDHGYDLRASDIRGSRETRALIALALRSDAEGNRAKATELFEEAIRRGSASAYPAAFLSSFNDAAGNDDVAKRWESIALSKLRGASPYESLLVRYLVISQDMTRDLALAKSALELRPNAWRLRLAAAHLHLQRRERQAALRELQQIDVSKPDDRRLMLVLSDRASLGDIDGAARDVRRSRLAQRPALLHYTEGRIAWSRGQIAKARALWLGAANEAAAASYPQLEVEALELAGIAAIRQRDWTHAQRYLARANAASKEIGNTWRTYQTTVLGAYAAHQIGDYEQRDQKLQQASTLYVSDHSARGVLRMLAIRLGSPLWRALPPPPADLPELVALMQAREAFAAGDRDSATRSLRRAYAEGIERTHLAEDAELLAAELGLPFTRLAPDPPYPNLIRYLAIFDLDRVRSGSGSAPAPPDKRP
jgi:Protein kinase domain